MKLVATAYIVSRLALLTNDYFLKDAYRSTLTGKISDFAGLYCLAVFMSAASPRNSRSICCAIAVAFIAWKSPVSQPAIDLWNQAVPHQIDRVVDYSDLIALAVLPLSASVAHTARRAAFSLSRLPSLFIAVVSLFAFAGTSVVRYSAPIPPDPRVRVIEFSVPFAQVEERLNSCGYTTHVSRAPLDDGDQTFIHITLRTRRTKPERTVSISGTAREADDGVIIQLEIIHIYRQRTPIAVDPYAAEASALIQRCLATPAPT